MNVLEKDKGISRIPDIKEAYKNLHSSLGDEAFKEYTGLLKLYFSTKISKLKLDEDARNLLCSPEHLHLHNLFLLSLSSKYNPNKQHLESIEYISPSSPLNDSEPGYHNIRFASQEMCLLNDNLLKDRISVSVIDQGLEGAEDAVTDIILVAVQMFLKNIFTAMLTRTSGYKIRENNFQHAIGMPAVNPWLRNSSNIIDPTQESNVDVNSDEKSFEPIIRNTLDVAEQQTAFGFSCSRAQTTVNANRLNLRCLYETLLENPHVINNHTIYSINLERILALLDCS